MNLKLHTLILGLLLISVACNEYVPAFPDGAVEGLKPVYSNPEDFLITQQEKNSIGLPGKIYVYGDLLLINEVNKGIHVIDNTDASNPENLYFIDIPGNSDMAVKDDHIYVNNKSDLVILALNNDGFEVVNRIVDLFLEPENETYPPHRDVYFECVDESKGEVVGWENAILDSPECYKR